MSLLPTADNPLYRLLNPGMPQGGGMGGAGGLFGRGPSWVGSGQGFGQQQGLRGLLSDPNFGLALLANSGYSPNKRSFGEILGQSALQARQMSQQSEENDLMRKYREAQIASLGNGPQRKPLIVAGPDGKPVYIDEQDAIGKTPYLTSSGSDSTADIQNWQFREKLTPEQQKAWDAQKRQPTAPQIVTIGQVPHLVDRITGAVTPLSSLDATVAAAGQVKAAEAQGKTEGEAIGGQTAKAPAKSSMDYVIGQFRDQIKKTPQGGLFGYKGKAAAVLDKKDRERFDNLREQLSTEMRTVYRIPGEGTLSDQEQKQYGIQLPSADYEPETNDQILNDIEARTGLRLNTPVTPAGSPASGRKKRYNPATGKIE